MLVSHEEYVYVYSMCMCMQRDTCIGSGEMVALTSSGISNAFAFLMNCFVFFFSPVLEILLPCVYLQNGQIFPFRLWTTIHQEIFTLLNFCEFCDLRLSRKNFSRKNLCRQLVGAVIVGRGILLS